MDVKDSAAESAALERVRHWCVSGEARRIRVAARLSGYQLARLAGVSQPAVSHWERGLRRPHGEAALRYHRALSELQGVFGGYDDDEYAAAS